MVAHLSPSTWWLLRSSHRFRGFVMITLCSPWPSRVVLGLLGLGGALFAANGVVAAEVFKCTNSAGKVEFTDAPCGTKQTSSVIDARPNSLDNSAVREQLLKIENRSLQEKLSAAPPAPATSLQAQPDTARADSPACRSAQRDAEAAATSIENNRDLIRARRSSMYIACGVREPDKQITNVNVGNRGDRPYVDPRTSTR